MDREAEYYKHPTDGPIHTWCGLSYCNYLVLPRTLMQSMPIEWQERMVACLEEMHDAFEGVPQAEGYKVEAATEHEVADLTDEQRTQLGITADWYRGEVPPAGLDAQDLAEWQNKHENPDGPVYYQDGEELDPHQFVMVPAEDPVPFYNRGRTYLQPAHPDGELCGDVLNIDGQDRVCIRPFGFHEKSKHVDADGYWWQQAYGRLSNRDAVAAGH